MTAPGETAVVGKSLGEAHADAGPDGCRQAHYKRIPTAMGRERGGEYRSKSGYRAVHQSRQTRLNDLQDKQGAVCLVLFVLDVPPQLVLFQFFRLLFRRALLLT